MNQVTQLLNAIEAGGEKVADQLLPLVYDELRSLAATRLKSDRAGESLQATVLVHEAYIRLVDQDRVQKWNSRGHFFAAAAEAMRRILVENARRKQSLKRGGQFQKVDLDFVNPEIEGQQIDLLALDEALTVLEAEYPEKAQLVKLRFFAGLTIPDAAKAMGISHATAERHWAYARTWLYSKLR